VLDGYSALEREGGMMLSKKALDALLRAHDEAWELSQNRLIRQIEDLQAENEALRRVVSSLQPAHDRSDAPVQTDNDAGEGERRA
jgi:hypothetical protein